MKYKAIFQEMGILAGILLITICILHFGIIDFSYHRALMGIYSKEFPFLLFLFILFLLVFLVYLPRVVLSRFSPGLFKLILLLSTGLLVIINTLLVRSYAKMELFGAFTAYPPLSILLQDRIPSKNDSFFALNNGLCVTQLVFVLVLLVIITQNNNRS
jgi:hypothetical protein